MSGLRRIAKLYGGITAGGVKHVWDYAADEPCLESEMPVGSDRWKASDRAKHAGVVDPNQADPRC